jgi:pimeloyl-ACP methyl ester carboxylesterase
MRNIAGALRGLSVIMTIVFVLADLCACQGSDTAAQGTDNVQATIIGGSIDGDNYQIAMPPSWNGTLVLYSHGYRTPGTPNTVPPLKINRQVQNWFFSHGYALAATSYESGWSVEQAFRDQIALLDLFTQRFGRPQRTIAWGGSMGGLISVSLAEQFPDRFSGALSECGSLAGAVGVANAALDTSFAFKTLLAPTSPLRLVHITDPSANLQLAQSFFLQAQRTPQGRAKLALAAALYDLVGWTDPMSAEPAPTDYTTLLNNQIAFVKAQGLSFAFGSFRVDLEQRSGGNPSWNIGVDYREELVHSRDYNEVVALYRQAGLDLTQDLNTLQQAPRIAPDHQAVSYLSHNVVLTGNLKVPVVTLHTTGDPEAQVEQEQAYASTVHEAGTRSLLRQLFVQRSGHCTDTGAELLTAFQALMQRIETGHWGTTQPNALNLQAHALGKALNNDGQGQTVKQAFTAYQPGLWPRPFDSRSPLP